MPGHIFPAPEAERPNPLVHPVFIPFQGCATRCVFCAQTLQTGERARSIRETLARLDADLNALLQAGAAPRELAFYGGTFTALPADDQAACLGLAAKYREKGLVTRVRASTRPDAVTPALAASLRDAGLDMLELGVQSFSDTALKSANRGYSGQTALAGCETVTAGGLALGMQLMPGMPGMPDEDFHRDLALTLQLAPSAVRLYPCLVLAGTGLAGMHARGEFIPWTLERTVPLLASAQLSFWRAGIPVIRIGLAPQREMDEGGLIAGPYHPALGSMVRGLALFHYLSEEIAGATRSGGSVSGLVLPGRFQGELWGHKGALKERYKALGITGSMVSWHDEPHCVLWGTGLLPLPD